MGLTNSQYDAIMRDYQRRQLKNKHDLDRRAAQVREIIPSFQVLEKRLIGMAADRARQLLEGKQEEQRSLLAEMEELRGRKARLLREAGFPEDYLEPRYECPDCRDTGYREGQKCHCFRKAQIRLLYAQSNVEEITGRENFASFTFKYFDDQTVIPQLGKTVRAHMKKVKKSCEGFVENFERDKPNLLFTGPTGVGKTFLTNCIAKELMDTCHSVIYLSAASLFEIFSKYRFERQGEEEKDWSQYIFSCDLLIIDDLGTELNNTFTSSQLFQCLNERLISKKSTIISTNLTLNELRDNYTERVTSRIVSAYQVIPLYGADIRYQKLRKKAD